MITKFLGLHHPFFRPLYRRVLTVLVIAIWAYVEYTQGNDGWVLFALGLMGACIGAFFIFTDPELDGDKDGGSS